MPYNYKQEAAKYMEQIKNEKDNSDKIHALKAIIGMMWQTGVDNVNDLPEKAAYTSPEVLAAELNINSPFKTMTAKKMVDLMTLYDLMDMQLEGGFGDHLLANTLSELGLPIPEAGKKAQQREAEFIEKDKLAKQEIEKNG